MVYNLLVHGRDDAWGAEGTRIGRDRILEYTDSHLKVYLPVVDAKHLLQISALPTLFAYEEKVSKAARVGKVVDIHERSDGFDLWIRFDPRWKEIPSSDLVGMYKDLGFDHLEQYRTHWALKDIDLFELLRRRNYIHISVSDFIVGYLENRGIPATNTEIAAAFREAGYEVIPKTMRGQLSRLALTGRIRRIRQGLYSSIEYNLDVDPRRLPEVEEQSPAALRFVSKGQEPVDFDETAGASDLQNDDEAKDRHIEVKRLAEDIIRRYNSGDRGGNAAAELIDDTKLLLEALGNEPRTVRAGLLIPRGDALRLLLAAQNNRDEFSDLPPLPDAIKLSLERLVSAYNTYVGLDSELSKRDEARFGPDARMMLVPPVDGQRVAHDAARLGAATTRVEAVLGEEAKVAPRLPNPDDRKSRRYSEGSKNLARALLGKAQSAARWAASHPVKVLSTGVALSSATIAACNWVVANETWLTTYFANNPAMLDIIGNLAAFLRTLPLGGI